MYRNNNIMIVLIILMTFLSSCEDNCLVIPQRSHLQRYPEMRMLDKEIVEFSGILHDTQTGYYAFTFTTRDGSSCELFLKLDKVAPESGWKKLSGDESNRLYIRKNLLGDDEVGYLEYAPSSKCFLFLETSFECWKGNSCRNRYAERIVRETDFSWRVFSETFQGHTIQ